MVQLIKNIFLSLKCSLENYFYFSIPCRSLVLLQLIGLKIPMGRVEVLVRALSFHDGLDFGPDPVCGASLLVLYSSPRGYSLGTSGFSSHQKPTTKTKNLFCNCAPRNTQRLPILLLLELQIFCQLLLTSLLFLPHTSQPCLEPKLQLFPLRHV